MPPNAMDGNHASLSPSSAVAAAPSKRHPSDSPFAPSSTRRPSTEADTTPSSTARTGKNRRRNADTHIERHGNRHRRQNGDGNENDNDYNDTFITLRPPSMHIPQSSFHVDTHEEQHRRPPSGDNNSRRNNNNNNGDSRQRHRRASHDAIRSPVTPSSRSAHGNRTKHKPPHTPKASSSSSSSSATNSTSNHSHSHSHSHSHGERCTSNKTRSTRSSSTASTAPSTAIDTASSSLHSEQTSAQSPQTRISQSTHPRRYTCSVATKPSSRSEHNIRKSKARIQQEEQAKLQRRSQIKDRMSKYMTGDAVPIDRFGSSHDVRPQIPRRSVSTKLQKHRNLSSVSASRRSSTPSSSSSSASPSKLARNVATKPKAPPSPIEAKTLPHSFDDGYGDDYSLSLSDEDSFAIDELNDVQMHHELTHRKNEFATVDDGRLTASSSATANPRPARNSKAQYRTQPNGRSPRSTSRSSQRQRSKSVTGGSKDQFHIRPTSDSVTDDHSGRRTRSRSTAGAMSRSSSLSQNPRLRSKSAGGLERPRPAGRSRSTGSAAGDRTIRSQSTARDRRRPTDRSQSTQRSVGRLRTPRDRRVSRQTRSRSLGAMAVNHGTVRRTGDTAAADRGTNSCSPARGLAASLEQHERRHKGRQISVGSRSLATDPGRRSQSVGRQPMRSSNESVSGVSADRSVASALPTMAVPTRNASIESTLSDDTDLSGSNDRPSSLRDAYANDPQPSSFRGRRRPAKNLSRRVVPGLDGELGALFDKTPSQRALGRAPSTAASVTSNASSISERYGYNRPPSDPHSPGDDGFGLGTGDDDADESHRNDPEWQKWIQQRASVQDEILAQVRRSRSGELVSTTAGEYGERAGVDHTHDDGNASDDDQPRQKRKSTFHQLAKAVTKTAGVTRSAAKGSVNAVKDPKRAARKMGTLTKDAAKGTVKVVKDPSKAAKHVAKTTVNVTKGTVHVASGVTKGVAKGTLGVTTTMVKGGLGMTTTVVGGTAHGIKHVAKGTANLIIRRDGDGHHHDRYADYHAKDLQSRRIVAETSLMDRVSRALEDDDDGGHGVVGGVGGGECRSETTKSSMLEDRTNDSKQSRDSLQRNDVYHSDDDDDDSDLNDEERSSSFLVSTRRGSMEKTGTSSKTSVQTKVDRGRVRGALPTSAVNSLLVPDADAVHRNKAWDI